MVVQGTAFIEGQLQIFTESATPSPDGKRAVPETFTVITTNNGVRGVFDLVMGTSVDGCTKVNAIAIQEELRFRVALSTQSLCTPLSSKAKIGIAIGSLVGLIILLLTIAIIVWCCKRRARRRSDYHQRL